jgi:hypothetical protein
MLPVRLGPPVAPPCNALHTKDTASSLPTLKLLAARPHTGLSLLPSCLSLKYIAQSAIINQHSLRNPSCSFILQIPITRLVVAPPLAYRSHASLNGALSAFRLRVVQPRSTIVPPPIHPAIILFRSSDALCCCFPATYHSNLVDTNHRFNCIECTTLLHPQS